MATSNTKRSEGTDQTVTPATTDGVEISTPSAAERLGPKAPSFGLCAGTVADLEQVEKTVDPFTGKVVTRDDVK